MKKETVSQTEKKSSFLFKIVATVTVLLALAFAVFSGKLYFEKQQDQAQKTNAIIIIEPDETENSDISSGESAQKIEINHSVNSLPEGPVGAKKSIDLKHKEIVEVLETSKATEDVQATVKDEKTQSISPEHEYFYVSIVIDDMGISPKHSQEIISLQAPLTSSFLTYGKNLGELWQEAKKSGHEIIMHAPMEPKVPAALAPDTLTIKMTDDEIETAFEEMLSKLKEADVKGINNHMGSLFTESAPKLDVVMRILKEKNMFFLDSKTSQYSQGKAVAELEGVPYIARDIFLDNENNYEYVTKQLKKTEKKARQNGYAVAIGHPKSETYRALKDWIEKLDDTSIKLVHLSELIALKYGEKVVNYQTEQ